MFAASNGAQTAMNARHACSERMPFSMPATICMGMGATASTMILKTGVVTSVSLFVLLLIPLLLVGLVVLISLLLTGLTGLVGLESLVGRKNEPSARTAQGD